MLVYDLFKPLAHDGAILQLRHVKPASYSPFCWEQNTQTWVRTDLPMDRVMSCRVATTGELAAAGVVMRDVTG